MLRTLTPVAQFTRILHNLEGGGAEFRNGPPPSPNCVRNALNLDKLRKLICVVYP
jgi:hypothetical protein